MLSKGEIDLKKVRVEFSLEDMDMSGFQKGATYEQIKNQKERMELLRQLAATVTDVGDGEFKQFTEIRSWR